MVKRENKNRQSYQQTRPKTGDLSRRETRVMYRITRNQENKEGSKTQLRALRTSRRHLVRAAAWRPPRLQRGGGVHSHAGRHLAAPGRVGAAPGVPRPGGTQRSLRLRCTGSMDRNAPCSILTGKTRKQLKCILIRWKTNGERINKF